MSNDVKISSIEQLTAAERRALRAGARVQRKIARGVKLCGAKTRQGRPCVATAMRNGRCKNHGGMSLPPKTPEGWATAVAKLKRRRKAEAAAAPDRA
jgi:hypothetical protein